MSEQMIEESHKFNPLAKAKELFECLPFITEKEWESASAFMPFQVAQALATLSIAESLDCISNDLAAIANMMADEAQEREAEQNRREWVRPGAGDQTP